MDRLKLRRAFQTGDRPGRSDGSFGCRLQEGQRSQVAHLAGMALLPVHFVGGSKRRRLGKGHGAEQEQRKRRPNPVL
jgi:hypothetical protein